MKAILLSIGLILGNVSAFAAGVDASSAKVTMYGAWISANADCSAPLVELFTSEAGKEVDIVAGDTIAEKAVTSGTYKCLVIKMNDHVKFKPASTQSPCTAGTEYTLDTCRSGNSVDTSTDALTGASIPCTTSSTTGDKVFLYISRNSMCTGEANQSGCSQYVNVFKPPASANDSSLGAKLGNDITITNATVGKFIFNTDGKVGDEGEGTCGMEPPLFGYSAG